MEHVYDDFNVIEEDPATPLQALDMPGSRSVDLQLLLHGLGDRLDLDLPLPRPDEEVRGDAIEALQIERDQIACFLGEGRLGRRMDEPPGDRGRRGARTRLQWSAVAINGRD